MIVWVIEDNQLTDPLVEFLKTIKVRVANIANIQFVISSACSNGLVEMAKPIEPVIYHASAVQQGPTWEGYCRKKNAINGSFSDGLEFYKVLLLDDLGGGNLYKSSIHFDTDEKIEGIILQIPTPLGSHEQEERMFYAWVFFAVQNNIPVIGYEFLPLNTRWSLLVDMLGGVITSREESYHNVIKNKIQNNATWLLPRHEGRFFSPMTPPIWKAGLNAVYYYQDQYGLYNKPIICLPQNVAMTYEYGVLLDILYSVAPNAHIVMPVGKDQIRGAYSHKDIVEKVYGDKLKRFSHSFHDLNAPWEIVGSSCIVGCAECFTTHIGYLNNIPTVVYDPHATPFRKGAKITTNSRKELCREVERAVGSYKKRTELAGIISEIKKCQKS